MSSISVPDHDRERRFKRAGFKILLSVPKAKVYLDSNIYKFSATQLPRSSPRSVSVNWGGHEQILTVHDPVTVNPNDRIENPDLKIEAELLPQVASLAKIGLVSFSTNIEVQIEIAGIPNLDSQTGHFYGADREIVDAPVKYSRTLFGGLDDPTHAQLKFLLTLKNRRFLELQRITGAYQGEKKVNRNQLLDAFHLWCAEHNRCDFFLSLDFKPARVIEKAKSKPAVRVVRPSQLLAAVRVGDDGLRR